MEKKTYKDLKDGDTVYVVDGVDVFEELVVKIREEQYYSMTDEEEKYELLYFYFLELFHQDGTKSNYYWNQSVAKFKNATNTNGYNCWDYLCGSVCFFNREDAVDYYKKSIKVLVDVLDKKIDNLEKQKCKYLEILNSFE